MSGDDPREEGTLTAQLARLQKSREQIAKAWLVDVILNSPLGEVEGMPMNWATGELPELISDILSAVGEGAQPHLTEEQLARAAGLSGLRGSRGSPGQLSREISSLHSTLLATMRAELPTDVFSEAAERLAAVFGEIGRAAMEAILERTDVERDATTGLHGTTQMKRRLGQMVASSKRYGPPFALMVLDVEGPGAAETGEGPGQEGVLAIVAAALRGSIRLVDEPFRLDEGALCVLAPHLTAADATQMAQRLARVLSKLQEAGSLQITISAGVVSCPEHGDDPERLLRQADTAMWRARATGQAVTVGALQDS